MYQKKSMNTPNLFIPGAGKSGTSSLHEYLNQHPDISMSAIKEPHYLSNTGLLENLSEDYLNLFNDNKFRGESSTGYMIFDSFKENVLTHCPEAKFIFVLRNPIDRLVSHYNWKHGGGHEPKTFWDAINDDKNKIPIAGVPDSPMGYRSYVQWGYYYKWLKSFYTYFDSQNIYIITTEQLKDESLKTLNQCFDFLNVERIDLDFTQKHNISKVVTRPKLKSFIQKCRIPFTEYVPYSLKSPLQKFKKVALSNCESTDKKLQFSLSKQGRIEVKNIYLNDVNELKNLTGLSFKEWKDFS
ncbi:sulfotransferase domain-containing protein [Lentisphaera marina]|uniref:sulfotransferase domain-containing protein n=1 Tax=Lentisphaera marina TaxID=1111041 RepID=UPI00236724F3|nr:sulfotransferase domain-containing protein [Lentisphaera marina]MDD7986891.1 sulfotransferase domain-containing protein [Lentisphaera marina]